ncbi:unnamed protein product [Darwinula stevensoni]|uniref:Uncharacterized protein n=1 Tax=Darwinula stevensoni TaxID=69355 RepID=A0A7R8X018_9CRUS|nr:unnamed protein product [Darwinula stevensoni]CAG0878721.1 unnamed protein product [Darwinula stevensoni]
MHVSDIHITVYGEHNRGPDLEVLLRDISKAVKPSVVLVSGSSRSSPVIAAHTGRWILQSY